MKRGKKKRVAQRGIRALIDAEVEALKAPLRSWIEQQEAETRKKLYAKYDMLARNSSDQICARLDSAMTRLDDLAAEMRGLEDRTLKSVNPTAFRDELRLLQTASASLKEAFEGHLTEHCIERARQSADPEVRRFLDAHGFGPNGTKS